MRVGATAVLETVLLPKRVLANVVGAQEAEHFQRESHIGIFCDAWKLLPRKKGWHMAAALVESKKLGAVLKKLCEHAFLHQLVGSEP